jgi:hypothetical protein
MKKREIIIMSDSSKVYTTSVYDLIKDVINDDYNEESRVKGYYSKINDIKQRDQMRKILKTDNIEVGQYIVVPTLPKSYSEVESVSILPNGEILANKVHDKESANEFKIYIITREDFYRLVKEEDGSISYNPKYNSFMQPHSSADRNAETINSMLEKPIIVNEEIAKSIKIGKPEVILINEKTRDIYYSKEKSNDEGRSM